MLTAVLLYILIAAVCAFAGSANYRHRMLEVFISDFIIAGLGAYLGGMLAGSFGPAVAGIPLAAAVGVAAPLTVLFNLITVPLTEERYVESELPLRAAIPEPVAAVVEPVAAIVEPIIAAVDSTLQPADPQSDPAISVLPVPGASAAPTPLKSPPLSDLPEVA